MGYGHSLALSSIASSLSWLLPRVNPVVAFDTRALLF